MSSNPKLQNGWLDIATFAQAKPNVKGVGTGLFKASSEFAHLEKIEFINATIRADNISGLAYYSKIGFVDYSVAKGIPLLDGTRIDRISKKYKVVAP